MPLHTAFNNGDLETVRLLMEANNHGVTPLQLARRRHHDDIVDMLQRAGATG